MKEEGTLLSRMQVSKVNGVKVYPSSAEDIFLCAVGSSTQGRWTARISMNGTPMEFQIDTGAEVMVITEKFWKNMKAPPITSSDSTLRSPASNELTTLGEFGAEMSAGQSKIGVWDHFSPRAFSAVYVQHA